MFALAIGLIAALWQAGEARRQARNATAAASRAQDEARTARAVQDFLLELFNTNSSTQSDPLKAQQMTARELLDRGAASVEEALQDAPMSRLEVLDTLANMYVQLGLEQRAADLQQRRVELARRTFGGKDARLAEVLLAYTETLQDGTQRNTIPALLDEARTVLDANAEFSTETYVDILLSSARYWRYESLLRARQSADEAVEFLTKHEPSGSALVTAHLLAARARINANDFDAAIKSCEQAIASASLQGEGAKAWLITPIFTLADVLLGQMRYGQCEQTLREAHSLVIQVQGEDHPEALLAKTRLGNLLISLGDIEQGEALHETVRVALRGTDPRLDSPMRSYLTGLLGSLYMERGRPDLMEPLLQDEIKDLLQTLPGSALLAQRLRQLAEVQAALGDQHSAHATMATALARWQAFSAGAGPTAVDAAFELSQARLALASGDAVRALTLLDATRSASPINAIERDVERAGAQLMQGQAQAALTCANAALLALSALPGGSKPVVLQANSLMMQGRALLATQHSDQAKAALESALALRRLHDLPQSLWCEQVASALINANSSR
jgi:serine/threonine-protein kinase